MVISATLLVSPTNNKNKNKPLEFKNNTQIEVKNDSHTSTMWSISKDHAQRFTYHRYHLTSREGKGYNFLMEDFEDNFPPDGWTVQSIQVGDSTWHKDARWSHSGDYSSIVWWSYQAQDEWLITPPIYLSGSPDNLYYFSFWTYAHKGSTYGDHYYVLITNNNGATWDTLFDFSSCAAPDTGWVDSQYVFDVSSYAGDTVQFAFNAVADSHLWYIWAIDYVNVYYPYSRDIAVLQITSPQNDTIEPGTYPIRAIFKNEGLLEDTFTARATVDSEGITLLDTSFSITLSPGAEIDTSFGDFDFLTDRQTYNITISAILSSDEDLSNNTLSSSILVSNPHHGGPDGFGYSFKDSDYPSGPVFSWIDPTDGNQIVMDDDDTTEIDLPFDFWLYDKPLNHLILSSNGFLAGYTSSTGSANRDLPDTTKIDLIAPWWDDLDPSSQGEIYYYVPSDSSFAVIAFVNVPHWLQTEGNTFEIILYPNGNILMQYEHVATEYADGSTVGIQGGKGEHNYYLKYTFNGYPIIPHDSLAILFEYPQVEHDLALSNITPPLVLTSGETSSIQVKITNLGINNENNVPVRYEILEDATVIHDEVTYVSIDSFSIDTLNFNVPEIDPGKYTVRIYIDGFSDERPFNDTAYTYIYRVTDKIDFETNAARFQITGKWEWGTPSQDSAPSPHSGIKLMGTVLADDYENDANYTMDRKFVITGDDPILLFYHWYDTERKYDGGNVKISRDNGNTFAILYPANGYPIDTIHNGNAGIPDEPGFSGHKREWELVEMPVSGCNIGDTVIIRWQFGSDGSINYPGWFIDDISGLDMEPYYPEHDLAIIEVGPVPPVVTSDDYFIPYITIANIGKSDEDFILVSIVDSEGVNLQGQTFQGHIKSMETRTFYMDPVFTGNSGLVYHVKATISPVSGEDTTNNSFNQTFVTAALTKEIPVPVASVLPSIDGTIEGNEWNDAEKVEISDLYGQGGTSVSPLTATLYIKMDTIYARLFVAIVEKYDSTLTDYDQIGLFFDENNDGQFPDVGDNSEGNYCIVYHPANISYIYRPLYNDGTSGDTLQMHYSRAISLSSGTVTYELEIPVGSEPEYLNVGSGDTVGFFMYASDAAKDSFYAWWPYDLSMNDWNNPSYYGKLYLPSWTGIKEHKKKLSEHRLITRRNIFTSSPVFKLSVPARTKISITLYDVSGRTVVNSIKEFDAGIHTVKIGNKVKAGIYFLRISSPKKTIKRKIMITH